MRTPARLACVHQKENPEPGSYVRRAPLDDTPSGLPSLSPINHKLARCYLFSILRGLPPKRLQPFYSPAPIRRSAHVEEIRERKDTKPVGLATFDRINAVDEFVGSECRRAPAVGMHAMQV